MLPIELSALQKLGHKHQLLVLGSAPISDAERQLARSEPALRRWQESGFAAEMSFMLEEPADFTSLARLLESGRSVVSIATMYQSTSRFSSSSACPPGYGRIARYAWGRDYHRVVKKRLSKFVAELESIADLKINWRGFSDAVPILERPLASALHGGFTGKNTLQILPGIGSYFFLSELLLDLEVKNDTRAKVFHNNKSHCGTCRRCLDACPTRAFESEYVLNAGKCISYLTIEKRGEFSSWEEKAISNWLFGCDICQEVCPFNAKVPRQETVREFLPDSGSGELLSLRDILTIRSDEEYLRRFAGTPLMRTKRSGLLRNAAAVVANTNYIDAFEELLACLEDGNEVVRKAASSSLREIRKSLSQTAKEKLDRGIKAFEAS